MLSPNLIPSETQQLARRLLSELLGELDECKIAAEIDAPIDDALTVTTTFPGCARTYTDFLQAAAAFVERVNRAATRASACPAAPITLDEVAALLSVYQGPTASGHEAAVLDAHRDDGAWASLVLLRLGEAMRASRREARLRRLEAQYTHGLEWETRCELVRVLVERAGCSLPPELASCPPEQLAGHVFELVRALAT